MRAWRVAVCFGLVALAGCSGTHRGPPHTVTMPRDGRDSATLEVVNGAATITVGTAGLGGGLIRASPPRDSSVSG